MIKRLCDLITRIRNASMVKKLRVTTQYSKLCHNVCQVLQKNGYLEGVNVDQTEKNKHKLCLDIGYRVPMEYASNKTYIASELLDIYGKQNNTTPTGNLSTVTEKHASWISGSAIKQIRMVSKPGYEVRSSYKNFYHIKKNPYGILIISTSQGIMTCFEAQNIRQGGLILLEVF